MEPSLPHSSERNPAGTANWNIIIQRVESHLQHLFGEELQRQEWQSLPVLGPKQHFYPPNVKFVPAQPSIPLKKKSGVNQLEREGEGFINLMARRRNHWITSQLWDETDSELSTSSSDSDQEFEVEKIIDRREDDDGNVSYLVTWKYYPGESTWVKKSNMENSADLIEDFENKSDTD